MRARTYDRYARIGMFLGPDRVIVSAPSMRVCCIRVHPEIRRGSACVCARAGGISPRLFIKNFRILTSHIVLITIREQNVKNDLRGKGKIGTKCLTRFLSIKMNVKMKTLF